MRTAFGYLLIDSAGLASVRSRMVGDGPWPRGDLLSVLPPGRSVQLRRAEAGLRRAARARCLATGLAAMLRRHLPRGTSNINVGHSNLTGRVLAAVRDAGCRVAVLVHDVIPLEHPEFQREGSVERFRGMLDRVAGAADLLICNSHETRRRTEALIRRTGALPRSVVAHLGVAPATPDARLLPERMPPDGPYFVVVGTLEPRKNIGFLLDLWDEMGPDAPPLLLCGQRGWKNEAVFARLDALPADGPVREIPRLGDAALSALVVGARALLFPTLAEGYGLPAAEAAALGTPVLCNDLPVLREVLGDFPVYATVSEPYLWKTEITGLARSPKVAPASGSFVPARWSDHFKVVLSMI